MDTIAGMGVVSESTASYDGSTTITVSPNSLYAPDRTMGTRIQMGASWTSGAPEVAVLALTYGSNVGSGMPRYLDFRGVDIDIDGRQLHVGTRGTSFDHSGYNTVSRTIYTHSTGSITLDLATLRDMTQAKRCMLRIHTGDGYDDIEFSRERIPGGKPTAINSIRKMLERVKSFQHRS